MSYYKYLFPILFIFYISTNPVVFATTTTDPNTEILLEIIDKYKEVRLGITETSIYLEFGKKIQEHTNQDIFDKNILEANHFLDSEGFFIPNNSVFLEDTKIEYLLTDIESISLQKGRLQFKYRKRKAFGFEDITNTDGSKLLNNFSQEDLELFLQLYIKLSS